MGPSSGAGPWYSRLPAAAIPGAHSDSCQQLGHYDGPLGEPQDTEPQGHRARRQGKEVALGPYHPQGPATSAPLTHTPTPGPSQALPHQSVGSMTPPGCLFSAWHLEVTVENATSVILPWFPAHRTTHHISALVPCPRCKALQGTGEVHEGPLKRPCHSQPTLPGSGYGIGSQGRVTAQSQGDSLKALKDKPVEQTHT